ncbi:hypothetical protein AX14_005574 [Amanita brunnescens Koide BX004]|nr:hypothetical protein AX14_005574 [Amanita brunnescens Koide BX004]
MQLALAQPEHEIVIVQTPEELQQCYNVRFAVFVHEQKFPLDIELDEFDETATHFLLRLTPSLTPIGTIRTFQIADGQYYKLTRLAVLKEYRRFSFGRKLVQAMHDWVRDAATHAGQTGSVQIVAHSQIPVKGFYAKFGYRPEGEEFDECGDPHQKMVLHLPLHSSS